MLLYSRNTESLMAKSFIEFFSTESKGPGGNWFGKLNPVFKRQRSTPKLGIICRPYAGDVQTYQSNWVLLTEIKVSIF